MYIYINVYIYIYMHEPLPVTSEDVSSYLAPSCSVDDFAIDTLLVDLSHQTYF
jgi:hypothetical protein